MKYNDIEKEVNKTLNSLDELERVEGNPYLYTRVKAALAKPSKGRQLIGQLSLAMTLLLILVNGVFIFQQVQSVYGEEAIRQSLSNEYSFHSDDGTVDYFIKN